MIESLNKATNQCFSESNKMGLKIIKNIKYHITHLLTIKNNIKSKVLVKTTLNDIL